MHKNCDYYSYSTEYIDNDSYRNKMSKLLKENSLIIFDEEIFINLNDILITKNKIIF